MTTIREIHKSTRIPEKHIRKLFDRNLLAANVEEGPPFDKMTAQLKSKKQLTAKALTALVENPDWIFELGPYWHIAETQLENLGNAEGEKASPKTIEAFYYNWRPTVEQVETVARFAKQTIPASGYVNHHYLAVRILLAVEEGWRKRLDDNLRQLLFRVRYLESFKGWHTVIKASDGRKETWYHRPECKFDL